MDEPFVGTIFMFGGGYAPHGFAYCWGQSLVTQQNAALYAIIGGYYGPVSSTNFYLPDFRGRVPVGFGAANTPTIGATGGVQTITLAANQLPPHSHTTIVTAGTGPSSATVTLNGINGQGGQANPGGNFLGSDTGAGATSYALPTAGTPIAMAAGAVTISNISAPVPTVTVNANTPSGAPVSLMQPYIVVNYIIALNGLFPSRN